MNRHADYTVANFQRTHNFRGYATFELPFGPGKVLGGNTSGIVARVIEGWQFGTIFRYVDRRASERRSEQKRSIRTGTPDIVGDFPREGRGLVGRYHFGNYFAETLYRVTDPACRGCCGQTLRVLQQHGNCD